MLDKTDYTEPCCPLSGGKAFYDPSPDTPRGRIPVSRILERVDRAFHRGDYAEAGRLLRYWREEAVALCDREGELTMESELVGYCRKQNDREGALSSAARALALTEALEQGEMASGATVLLNCATAYKAFGMAEEAMPLYRRAEAVYRAVLKPGDARFGGLYNNMALALADLGQYREAESAYRSALSVMEAVTHGEAECAITYINLAHMYDACGKAEKVLPCMEKAFACLGSETLPHDGDYAFVLEKCAPSFAYFGQAERCDQMKAEAERIYAGA